MGGTENEISEQFDRMINDLCASYHRIKDPQDLSQEALEEMRRSHMEKYNKALSLVPRLPNSEISLRLLAKYVL